MLSYSFMAVMHWCLVLTFVVTPFFIMVSWPEGGVKATVVPNREVPPVLALVVLPKPERGTILVLA